MLPSVNAATREFADEGVRENVAVTVTASSYVVNITQSVAQNVIDDSTAGHSVHLGAIEVDLYVFFLSML